MQGRLPPTSYSLIDASHRPYFLWWTQASVADLRAHLEAADPEVRAYWMGALLREANTRDVWLFVTPAMIRASWDRLQRHLGRSRAMWAYLLDLPDTRWPPDAATLARRGIGQTTQDAPPQAARNDARALPLNRRAPLRPPFGVSTLCS